MNQLPTALAGGRSQSATRLSEEGSARIYKATSHIDLLVVQEVGSAVEAVGVDLDQTPHYLHVREVR